MSGGIIASLFFARLIVGHVNDGLPHIIICHTHSVYMRSSPKTHHVKIEVLVGFALCLHSEYSFHNHRSLLIEYEHHIFSQQKCDNKYKRATNQILAMEHLFFR